MSATAKHSYFVSNLFPKVGDIVDCFSDKAHPFHCYERNIRVIEVDEWGIIRLEGGKGWYDPRHFALSNPS